MPECLCFDFFGTLVSYEADRLRQRYDVSHQWFLTHVKECSHDQYLQYWEAAFQGEEEKRSGTGREFHMLDAAESLLASLEIEADDTLTGGLVESYLADWANPVTPVPGVSGMLSRLSRHYRLALISNTHYPPLVRRLLEEMNIAGLFEEVILSVEIGFAKPHPAIFEAALGALDIAASAVAYVGDNYEHDYRGATAAGMDCYLIGRHARVPRDRQLRSILDLPIYFNTSR